MSVKGHTKYSPPSTVDVEWTRHALEELNKIANKYSPSGRKKKEYA